MPLDPNEILEEIADENSSTFRFIRKEQLISKSGIRNIFTPHCPISSIDLFVGRETEIQNIIEYLNTPGQHALIYGNRGIGKSSLANISIQLIFAGIIKGDYFHKRCDSNDTFITILQELFDYKKINIFETKTLRAETTNKKAGISIPVASASLQSQQTYTSESEAISITPSYAAHIIKSIKGILVIDEADILASEVKEQIAELIKLLSDFNASLKILVVGIATTSGELMSFHKSVQRCLKETKVKPMSAKRLEKIIVKGLERFNSINKRHSLKLTFDQEVISIIAQISDGYPYYAHLFSLKCAEYALSSDKVLVDQDILEIVFSKTIREIEDQAELNIDPTIRDTLISCSTIDKELFRETDFKSYTASEQKHIRNQLEELSKGPYNPLCEDSSGCFYFKDPRIHTYLKLLHYRFKNLK